MLIVARRGYVRAGAGRARAGASSCSRRARRLAHALQAGREVEFVDTVARQLFESNLQRAELSERNAELESVVRSLSEHVRASDARHVVFSQRLRKYEAMLASELVRAGAVPAVCSALTAVGQEVVTATLLRFEAYLRGLSAGTSRANSVLGEPDADVAAQGGVDAPPDGAAALQSLREQREAFEGELRAMSRVNSTMLQTLAALQESGARARSRCADGAVSQLAFVQTRVRRPSCCARASAC